MKFSKYSLLCTGVLFLWGHLLCRLSCLCSFSFSLHTPFPGPPGNFFTALQTVSIRTLFFCFLSMSCSKNCIIYGLTGALQCADHRAFPTLYQPCSWPGSIAGISGGSCHCQDTGEEGLWIQTPAARKGNAEGTGVWINRRKTVIRS